MLCWAAVDLKTAVFAAGARPEVCAAVAEIYTELDREVARRRPLCVVSGRCCRFEEYGHRLFVTTLELAAFIHDRTKNTLSNLWDGRGCP